MLNFYPGPSKLHPSVKEYVNKAIEQGFLSLNHRSDGFKVIYEETIQSIRDYLKIPSGYHVAFTSSATESWEIVVQNFASKHSLHIFNGAFGKKWFSYNQNLGENCSEHSFNQHLKLEALPNDTFDLVCATHCETSNGYLLSESDLKSIREKYDSSVIAIDATSSIGGVNVNFEWADIWFASVQKCFGLPPGLALVVYNEKAVSRATKTPHYNDFLSIHKNGLKGQTTHTPNSNNIFILGKVCNELKDINTVHSRTTERAAEWKRFITSHPQFDLYTDQCETVLTIAAQPDIIEKLHIEASKKGIILGKGYGELKQNTFRIANFPAIEEQEIETLQDFLTNFK